MSRGLSLIEILIAVLFLAGAVLSLFGLQRIANQGSMDASFETLCTQLAREPLEIFRAFGVPWVAAYREGRIPPLAPDLQLGTWCVLEAAPASGSLRVLRSVEANRFQRRIRIISANHPQGRAALLVEVEVAPVPGSNAQAWMTRPAVVLHDLLLEEDP